MELGNQGTKQLAKLCSDILQCLFGLEITLSTLWESVATFSVLSFAVINSNAEQGIISPYSAKGVAQSRCSHPEEKSKKTNSDTIEMRKSSQRSLLMQIFL